MRGPGRRQALGSGSSPGPRRLRATAGRGAYEEEKRGVGHQGGGRVWLFLHTDDFWRDFPVLQARGLRFLEAPRAEPYGHVAVFEDPYGKRWDLLEPLGS